ncbi:inner membrane protein [Pseudooceanicola batsensis HTCC2597]|uniref:Inner membrane protein n=1 Tax=Pseudooceanicola batsensis (strain ATCC BAA-863 / DSM 15984 / KCTC 12145 / HTCC2597) TaxID=252305 RepID=A3TV51_PSEBH|nr:MAPEG family protein [Pseudooceanicola batsensis]EAQ04397.1 inner membrane protein [Pseudooceanicola batsensis HTCC2597]
MTLTSILALYGIVVLVTILAQVLAAARKLDLSQLAGNRESLPSLTGMAGRLDRAQMNSVVAMALFAPPVLILAQQPEAPGAALTAAWLFLLARIAYVVVYALGIAYLRTAIWLVGFAMIFWLYLLAL